MSDNTAVTPGAGTTIRTDDVGGIQYQVVKLDGGGDGLTVPITAGQQAGASSLPVVIASDQSAVPVSAASLPLPSGASTLAKQPALGTAGTASADVITVQGIASMTPLKVDGSAVTQPVSGTLSAAQSGTWTVTINADALTYTPVGSETGLVVRPLPSREQLTLERLLLVLIEETRQSRRAFLDWAGTSDPRQIYSDNVNLVQ